MDPDGRQTADGSALDDNVVRLPRDWLGPRDELIPLGSSANGHSAARRPSASDFWGEASSSLQSAVEAPAPPRRPSGRIGRCRRLGTRELSASRPWRRVGRRAHRVRDRQPQAECRAGVPTQPGRLHTLRWRLACSRTLEWSASRPGRSAAERGDRDEASRDDTGGSSSRHRTPRRTVIVEQVRYVSAPTQSSGAASGAASSPSTGTSSPQTSSASSNPAAGSVNQPAVGADGALGPGTSPDG